MKTQPIDSDDKGKVPDDGWAITIANPTMAEMDVVALRRLRLAPSH